MTGAEPDSDVRAVVVEQQPLDAFVDHLERRRRKVPAFEAMLTMYRITRTFPDMSNFRLGPNMFEKTPLDWIMLISHPESSRASRLVAHGIAARIPWTGDPRDLPGGWQGVVRYAYENAATHKRPSNTLVGLFIRVEEDAREEGWAAHVVDAMKALGSGHGLSRLIIPLRLPTRYERPHAAMPFEAFAYRKREDGEYCDHWLRLHVRLGATIVGHCDSSHQHTMNLADFHAQFESEPCEVSGDRLAQRHGEWYLAYVDVDRDFAVINEGCVWVQHALLPAG